MDNKLFVLFTLGLLAASISACQPSERTPEPWIPVLEDTSFSYLKDSVSETQEVLHEAAEKIGEGERAEFRAMLERAEGLLLKLHFYYLPMTEVRQLVYDADRLFYLKQLEKTQEKLREANRILMNVATSDGPNLEQSVNELISMIDELIRDIQESSHTVPEKFRDVGHRVNFMCLKGELVLSGDKFRHQH